MRNYPNYMVIRKEGFFYTVRGGGAALLGNMMGYKVSSQGERFFTGTTVIEPVLSQLKDRKINYILIIDNDIADEYFDPSSAYSDLIKNITPQPNCVQECQPLVSTVNESNDIPHMLATIETILQGIDPSTGEYRNGDSLYSDKSFRSVLLFAQKELKKRHVAPPKNAGIKWTEDEDSQLGEELETGMSINEIATIHGRTCGAIISRVEKKYPEYIV